MRRKVVVKMKMAKGKGRRWVEDIRCLRLSVWMWVDKSWPVG